MLRADGTEHWRFERTLGDNSLSPRLWAADLNRDGLEELILVTPDGVEALDVATKSRAWLRACPPSNHVAIQAIRENDSTRPPVIEVFAGNSVQGLSGDDGQVLWVCAGVPHKISRSDLGDNHAQRLGTANHRFPPAFLCEVNLGAGDTICLQAEPEEDTDLQPLRARATTTPSRDPRFIRLAPWQIHSLAWPVNSPAWLTLGVFLFLPAIVGLPVWSLYTILWQRRWSLRFWLMQPLVVLLLLFAFTIPAPNAEPGMGTYEARVVVSLFLLPIVAFLWQTVDVLRKGLTRQVIHRIGISIGISLVVGLGLLMNEWLNRPAGEYWEVDWSWIQPFLLGLYVAMLCCVASSLIKKFAAWAKLLASWCLQEARR